MCILHKISSWCEILLTTSTVISFSVPMLNPTKIVRLPMTWRSEQSVIFYWVTLQNFRGAITPPPHQNKGRVVTRKKNIRKIPLPTWVIQCVEALAMRGRWDIADGDELLFVDRFDNGNVFAAAFHEGGIIGVAQ